MAKERSKEVINPVDVEKAYHSLDIDLKAALDPKIKLYFDSTGKFKVVIFSDLRLSKNVDPQTIANIITILDREQPSLVLFGGDIHDGSITNEEELRKVLDAVNAPLAERNIYWCHTFGVDTEGKESKRSGYSRDDQMLVYKSYPLCLSVAANADIYGTSNYVLPIFIKDGGKNEKIGFNIWCLDSAGYLNSYVDGLEDQVLLEHTISGGTNLDCLHFSQILWYWDTSVALEEHNKEKIPGMMYFQVPVYQFMLLKRNIIKTGVEGNVTPEATIISAPERESGIVWTCYERGDIRGIFCGYNAENEFSGTYLDMMMAFCSTVGKTKLQDTAGARVVEISDYGKIMASYISHL